MDPREATALRAAVEQLTCHVALLHSAFAAQQEALLEAQHRLDSLDRELYHWQRHIRQLCRSFRKEYILNNRVADRVGALEEPERVAESHFSALEDRVYRVDQTQLALKSHIAHLHRALLRDHD